MREPGFALNWAAGGRLTEPRLDRVWTISSDRGLGPHGPGSQLGCGGGQGKSIQEGRSVAGLKYLHPTWDPRGANVGLVKKLANLSGLASLWVGLFIISLLVN